MDGIGHKCTRCNFFSEVKPELLGKIPLDFFNQCVNWRCFFFEKIYSTKQFAFVSPARKRNIRSFTKRYSLIDRFDDEKSFYLQGDLPDFSINFSINFFLFAKHCSGFFKVEIKFSLQTLQTNWVIFWDCSDFFKKNKPATLRPSCCNFSIKVPIEFFSKCGNKKTLQRVAFGSLERRVDRRKRLKTAFSYNWSW